MSPGSKGSETQAAGSFGRHERIRWSSNWSGPSKKHRRSGHYDAFIPSTIATRSFQLDDEAVAAVVDATKALAELNGASPRLARLSALAKNLVRSEAVASSRIEGIVLSHKRLARAAYRGHGRSGADRRATEILANVSALEQAVELGAKANAIDVGDIQDVHRTLLRFVFDDIAGVIRDRQNWIGGSDYHPLDAAYVPPPPEHVAPLLGDLCSFMARDDMAPVVQAAIVHAQFETIHPFADGNGRVGRALIYTILRRREESPRYIPPISLVLASEPRTYIGGLIDYRDGQLSEWCTVFAVATSRAAALAEELARRIEALQQNWIERLDNPRRDSVVRELIACLPEQPVIDVAAGTRLTGKSHVAVGAALRALQDVGALKRLNEKKWGHLWECEELIQLVDEIEKQMRGDPRTPADLSDEASAQRRSSGAYSRSRSPV